MKKCTELRNTPQDRSSRFLFPNLENLIEELKNNHGCHTIILYGSHARGDATEKSDLDFLGIRNEGSFYRIGRVWRNILLDGFIYPEKDLPEAKELLRLEGAKILLDSKGFAKKLLKEVSEEAKEPVEALPEWDKELRKTWIKKMYQRSQLGDVEGCYRLHWLLFDLLENWFHMNQIRFQGSKNAFSWLKENRPELYKLFEHALKPGASSENVESLIKYVVEET